MYGTPTYVSWCNMRQRCTNPNHKSYQRYGAKGVEICERWKVFDNFLADMGPRPVGCTLERDNNARGYEPGNCSWQTPKTQARNRSSTRFLELEGRRMCLQDWARETGISEGCLTRRLNTYRWPVEKALTTPVRRKIA